MPVLVVIAAIGAVVWYKKMTKKPPRIGFTTPRPSNTRPMSHSYEPDFASDDIEPTPGAPRRESVRREQIAILPEKNIRRAPRDAIPWGSDTDEVGELPEELEYREG